MPPATARWVGLEGRPPGNRATLLDQCAACLRPPPRRQALPGHNMLGLEIREPIIERANRWAEHLDLQRTVLFLR